ncbi:MAG: hypothetical protein R3F49_03545 [Planctomycetota bacterium]
MRTSSLCVALTPLTLLAACGGGSSSPDPGGNTTINGVTGPSGVSIVTADTSNVSTGGTGGGSTGLSWPVDSAYITDVARVHVFDPSMEALEQGNQILCMIGLTAYDQMVNEGNYIAQVDEDLCQSGQEPSEGNGESSAAAQSLMFFTVNAARASNTAPQINSLWVPVNGPNDTEMMIHARMTVEEGPSETDPFGVFQMNWAGVADGQTIETPGMFGVLKNDSLAYPGFEFFESQGDVDVPASPNEYSSRTAVHVSIDPVTQRGAARIQVTERYDFGGGDSGALTSNYRIAFNETHMKRQLDSGPVTTISRTDFTDRVYRYNLYYADGEDLGERVVLNSGFNIKSESGAYGWAGYHGIWMPPGVELADGDIVTRNDPGSSEVLEYTVDQSPGRLIEYSRETLALTELTGQEFEWWESGSRYRVDYSVSDFRRTGVWNWSNESWDAIEPPTVIDVAMAGGNLSMFSQSLGGPVNYVDGDDVITFFAERFVGPEHDLLANAVSEEVQLLGFMQCLRSGITGSEADTGQIYLSNAPDVNTPHVYRFNSTDLTLRHDPNGDGSVLNVVGLAEGETPTSGPNTWGMRSGPLVESTAGLNSIYEIWNVSTFYVYETGHNPWNQRVGLFDALGDPVVFDRPIEFLYTHSTANDMNDDSTYDGQSFFLSYNGSGNLHGVPFDPFDLDGDMDPDRWYPRFSIADGTLMGPNGDEYAIRAIEVEQTLNEDVGGAPLLDVTTADGLALPDGSGYETPDVGTRPEVTAAPAVINGEVQ